MATQDIANLILLILGSAFVWALTPSPLGPHRWIPLRFSIEGKNTPSKSQKRLIKDLKCAKESVFIVTSSGRDDFWGHREVVHALREAAKRRVELTFVVGPNFREAADDPVECKRNINIRRLALEGILKLRLLDKAPCAGFRLVDNNGTYTCTLRSPRPHVAGDCRPFLWTWHHKEVAETQRRLIMEYVSSSHEATENDLTANGACA